MPSRNCPECQTGPYGDEYAYCLNCGQILPGESLIRGKYRLVRILAKGGLGQIYLAQDANLYNRLCAIKRIGPPQCEVDLETSQREAQLLAQLQNSGMPGVPDIYDVFDQDDSFFLVMRFIEGQNLRRWWDEKNPTWQSIVERFIQVAKTLVNLHSLPVPLVHADIKPENIVQDEYNQVWLVDFGLARVAHATPAELSSYTPGGTVNFTPWEQWAQPPVPASDVYSLALSLYFLLVGPKVFAKRRNAAAQFGLPHPGLVESDTLDPAWPEILRRGLILATVAEPEKRLTAQQFLEMLRDSLPVHRESSLILRDGTRLRDLTGFIDLAENKRDYAISLLREGTLAAWLRSGLFQDDLAGQVEHIRRNQADVDTALEEVLHLLAPALPQPNLECQPADLSGLRLGIQPQTTSFQTVNTNRGHLNVHFSSPAAWIEISPRNIKLDAHESRSMRVTLYPHLLPPLAAKIEADIPAECTSGQCCNVHLSGQVSLVARVWHAILRPFFQKSRQATGWISSLIVALLVSLVSYDLLLYHGGNNSWPISALVIGIFIPLLSKLGAIIGSWLGKGYIILKPLRMVANSILDLYLTSSILMLALIVAAWLTELLQGIHFFLSWAYLPALFIIPVFAVESGNSLRPVKDDPYEAPQGVVLGPLFTFMVLAYLIHLVGSLILRFQPSPVQPTLLFSTFALAISPFWTPLCKSSSRFEIGIRE